MRGLSDLEDTESYLTMRVPKKGKSRVVFRNGSNPGITLPTIVKKNRRPFSQWFVAIKSKITRRYDMGNDHCEEKVRGTSDFSQWSGWPGWPPNQAFSGLWRQGTPRTDELGGREHGHRGI
jgi:hypothetical protein